MPDVSSQENGAPEAGREIILASEDGVSLAGRRFAARDPAASLLILHGMAEHIGRYRDFAGFLAAKGVEVYGFDLRGHGRTAELCGDAGFLTLNRGWDALVKDIDVWIDFIREENQGTPVFLLGHSLGSFLARSYASSYGQKLSGLILSGTGSVPKIRGACLRLAAKISDEINGRKEPSTLLFRFIFRMYARSVQRRRCRFDWLSRDGKIVDAYMADPLCGRPLPTGFMYDFLKAAAKLNKAAVINKTPRNLPVYIFSGSEDPVGNFSRGVSEVYKEYQKAGVCGITLKLYSGGRHEMLNETNRGEVYRDVFAWIRRFSSFSPP
ncbi:MAG: alpha/beta hydrolase [Spirochaetales bacterium]|nr:alpha/beta hydrolase [Spirochaetales bacterium]